MDVYPGEEEYDRLLAAFGFTDPAWFPKLFQWTDKGYLPVL